MKRLFAVLWLAAFLAGLAGVIARLVYGHAVAGYTSSVPWGVWVALYVWLSGLSAGAFLISSLDYVFRVKALEHVGKLAVQAALAALVSGLLAIWFDLGHMARFWRVLLTPNFRSMMTWMVWLYAAYFIVLVMETWYLKRADLARLAAGQGIRASVARALTFGKQDLTAESLARDARQARLYAGIGLPVAIAFPAVAGLLFGVVEARPYWNSALLPMLFVVSALTSGAALLSFLVGFWPPRDDAEGYRDAARYLGTLTLGLLVLELFLEVSDFLVGLYGTAPGHALPVQWSVAGPGWWIFWLLAIGVGALLPIVLLWRGKASPSRVGLAGLLVVLGLLAVRFLVVVPGLLVAPLRGLPTAYVEPRLAFHYVPSLVEWLVALFVLAVGIGLFYLSNLGLSVPHETNWAVPQGSTPMGQTGREA